MQDPCFVEEAQLIDVREPEEVYADVYVFFFFRFLVTGILRLCFCFLGYLNSPFQYPSVCTVISHWCCVLVSLR